MNPAFPIHKIALTGAPLPVDMEFKSERRVQRVFARHGLSPRRCFGSKSAYCAHNPGHKFLPNANVFCRTQGKLWWGDLDLARDKPDLESVARQLRVRLYVLSEHDGRFEMCFPGYFGHALSVVGG